MKLQLNKSAGGFYWDNISKLMWSGTLGRGNGTPRETWWSFATHFQYGNTWYTWYCNIYYATSDKVCQTSKVLYAIKSLFYLRSLIRIGQGFWGWFHNISVHNIEGLHSILWSFQLLPVLLMPYLCVFVLTILLQRDHKVLRCYIVQREVQSPSTSEKRSLLFYLLTTTSTSSTVAPASLSSSVCYCLCSTTSSTSYLLGKYSYRNRLA